MRKNAVENKLLDKAMLACADIYVRRGKYDNFDMPLERVRECCKDIESETVTDFICFCMQLVMQSNIPEYNRVVMNAEYACLCQVKLTTDTLKTLTILNHVMLPLFCLGNKGFFYQVSSGECRPETRNEISKLLYPYPEVLGELFGL